jgi:hypothetical protein
MSTLNSRSFCSPAKPYCIDREYAYFALKEVHAYVAVILNCSREKLLYSTCIFPCLCPIPPSGLNVHNGAQNRMWHMICTVARSQQHSGVCSALSGLGILHASTVFRVGTSTVRGPPNWRVPPPLAGCVQCNLHNTNIHLKDISE